MHIFITGVAGFLGSNLANHFIEKGHKVSGNDNLVGGDLNNIHPKVKGFQILNDNGIHLLGAYENKWIPDTPTKRNNIIKILKNWNSASNSSPIEGLEVALKRYTSRKHNTSIYIFGDEFTGGSYTPVFSTIGKLSIKRNVRINGIGFISLGSTNDRFATLMREIAENNNGTFLALPIVGMDLRQ